MCGHKWMAGRERKKKWSLSDIPVTNRETMHLNRLTSFFKKLFFLLEQFAHSSFSQPAYGKLAWKTLQSDQLPFESKKRRRSLRQARRESGEDDGRRAGAQDVLPRAQELHRDHAVPGVPQADKHGELSNAELRARRGSPVLAPEKVGKGRDWETGETGETRTHAHYSSDAVRRAHSLLRRYDPEISISDEISTESDRVLFLKSTAKIMLAKARVKLNLKRLRELLNFASRPAGPAVANL